MATESKAATVNTAAATLRGMSETELKEQLVKLRKDEFEARMERSTGRLTDNSKFKKIRREVARIKTILNEQKKSA